METAEFLNIQSFLQNSTLFDTHGILRSNRFMVLLNTPAAFNQGRSPDWLEWQVLNVYCPDITIDTESIEVNALPFYYLKSRTDQDLEIGFLDSADLVVRSFFYKWINAGFNQISRKRAYIDDIAAGQMKIFPLDSVGKAVRADVLYCVFPVSVSSIDYDLSAENQFIKTSVKFVARYHTVELLHL
jgi:hypothetical protein